MCKGYNLVKALQERDDFTEKEVAFILWQLLLAVNYCHKNDVMHRDIKLDNILIEKQSLQVKLIDFGYAFLFDSRQEMVQLAGTFMYMAPEIMSQKKPYDQLSDMWSVGIVAYILLASKFPFPGGDIDELKKRVVEGNFNKKALKRCSKGAINFLNNLL